MMGVYVGCRPGVLTSYEVKSVTSTNCSEAGGGTLLVVMLNVWIG